MQARQKVLLAQHKVATTNQEAVNKTQQAEKTVKTANIKSTKG
ncbi:hypothetical protein [Nostoc sp.]